MKVPSRPKIQSGFSLVELMIAVIVGLIILSAVVLVMSNTRKNYEVQDYTSRLQENARFAMNFLSHDLRMAGYYGCASTAGGLAGSPLQGTSSVHGVNLSVEYADPDISMNMLSGGSQNSTSVTVDSNAFSAGLRNNDKVVISDCGGAEVTRLAADPTSATNSILTLSSGLSRKYSANAVVYPLVEHSYSIQSTDYPILQRSGDDLVDGIEYLDFLFGIDTDSNGTVDAFQEYSSVSDWNNVVSVQMAIVSRSISSARLDAGGDSREFGRNVGADIHDGRIAFLNNSKDDMEAALGALKGTRRVFKTSIARRNAGAS